MGLIFYGFNLLSVFTDSNPIVVAVINGLLPQSIEIYKGITFEGI